MSQEYRSFWHRLADGQAEHGQYLRKTRDGQPIWLQASYNPVLDHDGKVTGIDAVVLDRTADDVLQDRRGRRRREVAELARERVAADPLARRHGRPALAAGRDVKVWALEADIADALSSGRGRAGVAVLRLSGPRAGAALLAIAGGKLPEPRFAAFRRLRNPRTDETLDRALALWFLRGHVIALATRLLKPAKVQESADNSASEDPSEEHEA